LLLRDQGQPHLVAAGGHLLRETLWVEQTEGRWA
jgi:hypothetical protein